VRGNTGAEADRRHSGTVAGSSRRFGDAASDGQQQHHKEVREEPQHHGTLRNLQPDAGERRWPLVPN